MLQDEGGTKVVGVPGDEEAREAEEVGEVDEAEEAGDVEEE